MAANPQIAPTGDDIIEADPDVSIVSEIRRINMTDKFSSSTMPLIPPLETRCTLLTMIPNLRLI